MSTRAVNAWHDFDASTLSYAERTDTGIVVRSAPAEFVSYLRASTTPADVQRELRVSRQVRSMVAQDEWLRVSWRGHQVRKAAEKWLRGKEVPTFEGDVGTVQRWLVDQRVEVQAPVGVYLDIETCARVSIARMVEHRILSWVLIGDDGYQADCVLTADDDDAERALLVRLWDELSHYDQVRAWNGDRFDFPVIFARTKRAKMKIDARQWLWLDQMLLHSRMAAQTAESGEEKQSMALQNVAQSVLGRGKIEGFPASEMFARWAAGGAERAALLAYNVNDVELQRDIEEKTGYIALMQSVAETCGTFLDTRGSRPTPYVETFLFRLGLEHGVHFPSRVKDVDDDGEEHEHEAFRGAFVMQPKFRGLTYDVHVADFAAMYPSIIQSWNMSPETAVVRDTVPTMSLQPSYLSHLPQKVVPVAERPATQSEAATGVRFRTDKRGLVPLALDKLAVLRKQWTDLTATLPYGSPEWHDAERRARGYKVINNGFFGVTGQPFSRVFDVRVAEGCSTTGAWLIEQTIDFAEASGLKVGYADTDSSCSRGCTDAEFSTFVGRCNDELYPRLTRERGCSENRVKITYEKKWKLVVFTTAKRYVARVEHYKGKPATEDSRPEIKGLEYRRGDGARLTRHLQAEVIDLLLGGGVYPIEAPSKRRPFEDCYSKAEQFVETIETWKKRILEGELKLDDVQVTKKLAKELKEYVSKVKKNGDAAKQPPQVRIGKMLAERGEVVREGTRVSYFTGTDGEIRPSLDWAGECDRFALWDDEVWPATRRLLAAAFPAYDWARWDRTRPRKGAPPVEQGALFSLDAIRPRHGGGSRKARK